MQPIDQQMFEMLKSRKMIGDNKPSSEVIFGSGGGSGGSWVNEYGDFGDGEITIIPWDDFKEIASFNFNPTYEYWGNNFHILPTGIFLDLYAYDEDYRMDNHFFYIRNDGTVQHINMKELYNPDDGMDPPPNYVEDWYINYVVPGCSGTPRIDLYWGNYHEEDPNVSLYLNADDEFVWTNTLDIQFNNYWGSWAQTNLGLLVNDQRPIWLYDNEGKCHLLTTTPGGTYYATNKSGAWMVEEIVDNNGASLIYNYSTRQGITPARHSGFAVKPDGSEVFILFEAGLGDSNNDWFAVTNGVSRSDFQNNFKMYTLMPGSYLWNQASSRTWSSLFDKNGTLSKFCSVATNGTYQIYSLDTDDNWVPHSPVYLYDDLAVAQLPDNGNLYISKYRRSGREGYSPDHNTLGSLILYAENHTSILGKMYAYPQEPFDDNGDNYYVTYIGDFTDVGSFIPFSNGFGICLCYQDMVGVWHILWWPEGGGETYNPKSIQISRSKGMAGDLSVEFDNKNGVLSSDGPENNHLLWPNTEITIRQGYGDQLIQTFNGLIDTISMSREPDNASVTVNARDKMKVLLDHYVRDETFNYVVEYENQAVEDIWADLIVKAGLQYNPTEATGLSISKTFSWETYADAISWLDEISGFETYCDEYGVMNFVRDGRPVNAETAYVFREGEDIITLGYDIDDSVAYYSVVVYGKNANGEVIYYTKKNPKADYWNIPSGKVMRIEASDADTEEKLQIIAEKAIYLMVTRIRKVYFEAIGVPHLQRGDFVQVIESTTTISEIYRITEISTAQDNSKYTMSLTCYYHGAPEVG